MPSIIKILPEQVINKIAAGEVVERPASVVKELIENSLDAGATELFIDVEKAGLRLIRVTDNGNGMSGEDARIAFERHATSKIRSDEELQSVRTMGFRGEALSSMASVARIRMITAERGALSGTLVEIEGGTFKAVSDTAGAQGTALEMSDLFYNTPARLKFLKSPATEFSHIVTAVSRQAMAHPSVRFRLTHNKKTVLDLPPSGSLKERAFQVYGSDIADNLIVLAGGTEAVSVAGLLGVPGYSRADKTYQDFYVNRRAVRNPSLTHALYAAYTGVLMRERHPVGFIFVDIDPAFVDVNVHPAKAEIRFRNQSQIHDLVRDAIRQGLRGGVTTPLFGHGERVKEAVADYLENAESGIRNGDTALKPHLPWESRSEIRGDFEFDASHSTIRIPQSEMMHPLAQIHDSFIVAQSREGMVIIDQHAAHERVLFEKLEDQFSAGSVSIQSLLIAEQVQLGPGQSALLSEHLPDLNKLGLVLEDYGSGAFMIKGAPSLLGKTDYKQLLLDILDEVNATGRIGKLEELRHGILSVMACHPAIKVHRKLDVREMEQLLEDLSKCRMPHSCPHGRPVLMKFSLDEIKRWFKRA